jgi:hypothetical protein
MRPEELESLTPEQLVAEANSCAVRAEKENTNLAGGHERRLLLNLQAQFYLTTATSKRADLAAVQDRRREHRRFLIELAVEVAVIVLIGIEIGLSIYFGVRGIREGQQQVEAMQAATDSLKTLAQDQAASLRILQEEQVEHAKKPKLALYVGNTLLDKAAVHLAARTGQVQAMASLDLLLKNEGDAPVSTFRVHALVPVGVVLQTDQLITVPESDPPANAKTFRVTLQLAPLPARQTVRIHLLIAVPNGHAPFKIPFTVDALELRAVSSLGSLTVLPPVE